MNLKLLLRIIQIDKLGLPSNYFVLNNEINHILLEETNKTAYVGYGKC